MTDTSLQRELAKARDGLGRIIGTDRFTWEATAACVALSAMARLEALAMTALDELKEGEQMKIKKDHPDSRIPTLGTNGAGAFDMYADISTVIYPGEAFKVPLGVAIELPANKVALLMPRSSTGSKGMHLANVIGLVDSDYRGTLIANLRNVSTEPMTICRGDRVCQMAIVDVHTPRLEVVDALSDTARGAGSFGSTGV